MQDGHRGRLAAGAAERGIVQEHPGSRPGAVRAAHNDRESRSRTASTRCGGGLSRCVDRARDPSPAGLLYSVSVSPGSRLSVSSRGRTAAHRDDRVFGRDAEGPGTAGTLRSDLDAAAREQADAPYGGPRSATVHSRCDSSICCSATPRRSR